jgi:cytochrome b561
MTDDAFSVASPAMRFERGRFDLATIAFHWTTLVLVLALFAIGWTLDDFEGQPVGALLLMVHRSLGVSVWTLTVARLAWRRSGAHLPPFPPSMPLLQQWAAKANEYGLYTLLILQPMTGFASTIARGRPFPLFGAEVPALMPRQHELAALLLDIHSWGAFALAGLVGVHATAGLVHGLVLRDGVLAAMFPWTRRVRS